MHKWQNVRYTAMCAMFEITMDWCDVGIVKRMVWISPVCYFDTTIILPVNDIGTRQTMAWTVWSSTWTLTAAVATTTKQNKHKFNSIVMKAKVLFDSHVGWCEILLHFTTTGNVCSSSKSHVGIRPLTLIVMTMTTMIITTSTRIWLFVSLYFCNILAAVWLFDR